MNKELLREEIKKLVYKITQHASGCWVERDGCPSATDVGCKHFTFVSNIACCDCCQEEYLDRMINEILGGVDNE